VNIGIFTIAYNGYGQFALQWCRSIAESTVVPDHVTLALFGEDHGLTKKMADECTNILPCLKIAHCGEHVSMGMDRNKAVEETPTTWVMLLDADDALLPTGLKEIERLASTDVDVIAVAYAEEKLTGITKMHFPPKIITNENLFLWRTHWISPYSPFRRSLWEKTPYVDGEFPNAPMVFSFASNEARFARTDVPCARHIRREGTHSARKSPEDAMRVVHILDGYARAELDAVRLAKDPKKRPESM